MEIHQVRYFLAVSRTLNFTRASEECHVSQPALSRAVQQLEGELGGELFRRERNHTHLTDLGRHVLPALQQCFDSAASARKLAEEFRKVGHAPFNLALARSIDMAQMAPVLHEIAAAFPRIEINIFRGPPEEIAERMKAGEVELALAEPFDDDWERFDAKKLFEERFGLLMTKADGEAHHETVRVAELTKTRLLCRPKCQMTETLVQRVQEAGNMPPQKHEVPLFEDLAGMVRAHLGVGVWPMSRRIDQDLSFNKVEGIDLSAWIHLYTVFGRKQSTAAATFIKLLRVKDWPAEDEQNQPAAPLPADQVHVEETVH
jgi:DNA-binding transcriptional LysR family regulator